MPSLKELRSQLKKSMKPISKMSRDEVVLMLEKHKIEPVEKPVEKPTKKAVEKEVKKQVKKPVEKEVKKQSSELKELKAVKDKKVAIKLP